MSISICYCVSCFIFDFWAYVFNGIRNIKYGRKFHFVGIYFSKFIFHLKFEKNSRFFRVLNLNSILNSKLWSLKCMIIFFLVCCGIPSIELVQKILTGYYLLVHNYYHLLKCKKAPDSDIFQGFFFQFLNSKYKSNTLFDEWYGY